MIIIPFLGFFVWMYLKDVRKWSDRSASIAGFGGAAVVLVLVGIARIFYQR